LKLQLTGFKVCADKNPTIKKEKIIKKNFFILFGLTANFFYNFFERC